MAQLVWLITGTSYVAAGTVIKLATDTINCQIAKYRSRTRPRHRSSQPKRQSHRYCKASVRISSSDRLRSQSQRRGNTRIGRDGASGSPARGCEESDIFYGRVDVLVNNAGYVLVGAIEESTPEETYDQFK
ncbi:hypothetical protein PM082_019014 [Marasmius tenuissimus]|nr:hypothetical protein PM082_019014 [Marasmius tenuissimus]